MNPQKQINFNVISEAFNLVKDRWQQFVLAGLLGAVVISVATGLMVFVSMAIGFIGANKPVAGILFLPLIAVFVIVMFALVSFVQAGLMYMGLKAVRGEVVESGDVFYALKEPVPFLTTGVLMGLAIAVGEVFCIFPALIVAGLTMFSYPFVIDKKLGPVDAIKASIDTLKGQWLMATLFALVVGLVSQLGVYACYVGWFFTFPVAMVSIALCYRDLTADGETFAPMEPMSPVVPGQDAGQEALSPEPVPVAEPEPVVEPPVTESTEPEAVPEDDVEPEPGTQIDPGGETL